MSGEERDLCPVCDTPAESFMHTGHTGNSAYVIEPCGHTISAEQYFAILSRRPHEPEISDRAVDAAHEAWTQSKAQGKDVVREMLAAALPYLKSGGNR